MKLAVVGSRCFEDAALLARTLKLARPSHVISGGALGADIMAENWAKARKIPVTIFKPEWGRYGYSAGAIRNRLIVDAADKVIAFWDGKSPGTKITMDYARKAGKVVEVIQFKTQEMQV